MTMGKWMVFAIVAAALATACNSARHEASAAPATSGSAPAAASSASQPPQGAAEQQPTVPLPKITEAEKIRAMRPPAGSHMALVVFEDLECPACARVEPLLESAHSSYKIPIVRHDFLIPSHNWSGEAHVMARYFDTVSPQDWARTSAVTSS